MNSLFSSIGLGLIAVTSTIFVPVTTIGATFDYSKLQLISTRPVQSNYVLRFFGDQAQNEGFLAFANADYSAPDAGHTGGRELNAGTTSYYTAGRETNLIPSGATRSASLNGITGFSNFLNYLNTNNIAIDNLGISYGPIFGKDITTTWNLGNDEFGKDWFFTQEGAVEIEELIYRANPDDVEIFLSLGNTKIVSFGYSPNYLINTNELEGNIVFSRNILLLDPVRAFKESGLDSLESGLADAFLEDVNAAGGWVQLFSDGVVNPATDVDFTIDNGYRVLTVSFPLELRAVGVPEPSSLWGLSLLGLGAIIYRCWRVF